MMDGVSFFGNTIYVRFVSGMLTPPHCFDKVKKPLDNALGLAPIMPTQ